MLFKKNRLIIESIPLLKPVPLFPVAKAPDGALSACGNCSMAWKTTRFWLPDIPLTTAEGNRNPGTLASAPMGQPLPGSVPRAS